MSRVEQQIERRHRLGLAIAPSPPSILTCSAEKVTRRTPWNKGKLVGAKPPLKPSHVWSIRAKLQIEGRKRDLALFNLAIDSKLRGCNVVAVRAEDVAPSGYAMDRATIRQKKTGRPVRFELTLEPFDSVCVDCQYA